MRKVPNFPLITAIFLLVCLSFVQAAPSASRPYTLNLTLLPLEDSRLKADTNSHTYTAIKNQTFQITITPMINLYGYAFWLNNNIRHNNLFINTNCLTSNFFCLQQTKSIFNLETPLQLTSFPGYNKIIFIASKTPLPLLQSLITTYRNVSSAKFDLFQTKLEERLYQSLVEQYPDRDLLPMTGVFRNNEKQPSFQQYARQLEAAAAGTIFIDTLEMTIKE